MEISEARKKELIRKLLFSRTRLLCSHPFFGLLLMRVKFALNEEIETAATDGEYIYFGLKFLTELSDGETDFVLMHEILHVALRHCFRSAGKDSFAFNIACDIVVNSNIMRGDGRYTFDNACEIRRKYARCAERQRRISLHRGRSVRNAAA